MPWVDKEKCTGCGICVEECPVGAIAWEKKAKINMDECIRCGTCHDVCPEKAVRHDSERILQEVEANVEKVQSYMKHFRNAGEKQACFKRSTNFFKFTKTVVEQTLEELEKIQKKEVSEFQTLEKVNVHQAVDKIPE